MEKRTLFFTTLSFICVLLFFISTLFAWFAMADVADSSFVGQVGDLYINYDLGQIVNGEITIPQDDTGFNNIKDIVPGSDYIFMLVVSNDSSQNAFCSVDINGIRSQFYDINNNSFSSDFENPNDKIQYSFSYKVLNCYWIDSDCKLINMPVSTIDNVYLPTETQIEQYEMEEFDEIDKSYLEIFEKRFNDLNNDTDKSVYSLVNNLPLKGSKISPDKNSFVLYFMVKFNTSPIFPGNVVEEVNFNSSIYENQVLGIDNIIITTRKEE